MENKEKYQDEFLRWSLIGSLKGWLKSYPVCNGVGVGFGEADEYRYFLIKVLLPKEMSERQRKRVPKLLEEVPIEYEVVGDIIAA